MRSSQRRARQRPRRRCVCCCCCSHCLRLCHFSVKLICCLPRTCSNACNNGNLPTSHCLPACTPFFSLCQLQPRQRQQFAVLSLSLSLTLCLAMNDTKVSFGNWQSGTKVACLSVCLRAYPLLPAVETVGQVLKICRRQQKFVRSCRRCSQSASVAATATTTVAATATAVAMGLLGYWAIVSLFYAENISSWNIT